ncbi:MAG: hypothetical protein H0U59_03940 [Gemmatimonadaceae bacterium]|nr:hypothetical protein [Gemmatimonadaceae bacterium]
MAIFPSATEMRSIFAPVVLDAALQLGSLATVYDLTPKRQLDGSTAPRLNDSGGYSSSSDMPTAGVPIRLTMLTSEKAQEIFGTDVRVTMQGSLPDRLTPVGLGFVFQIESGDFAGNNYEVTAVIENQYSDSYTLGLLDYEGEVPDGLP